MEAQRIENSVIFNKDISLYSFHSEKTKISVEQQKTKDQYKTQEDLFAGQYNANGEVEITKSSKYHLVLALQKQIDNQVKELTAYYKEIFDNKDEAEKTSQSLKEYFDSNPDALKDIQNGNIPEYWNKENTAKRIFDIAMQGYEEGMDKETFYEKTEKMINQAYSEVRQNIGSLPGLVEETQAAVLDGLAQFRDGTSISEVTFA